MSPFSVGVLSDRHHVLVGPPHQLVSGGDKNFHVIDLGPGLVESLFEILSLEGDKVDCGGRYNANDLSLF